MVLYDVKRKLHYHANGVLQLQRLHGKPQRVPGPIGNQRSVHLGNHFVHNGHCSRFRYARHFIGSVLWKRRLFVIEQDSGTKGAFLWGIILFVVGALVGIAWVTL